MFNHLVNPEYAHLIIPGYAHSVAIANTHTGEVTVNACDNLSIAAKAAYKRADRWVREAARDGEPAPCIRRWVDGVEQILPHRFECLVCGCDFPADGWSVCPHCGAVGNDLVEYTEVGA